jgi:hypothetical protein
MPDHQEDSCPPLLCERQELRRKPACNVAVERHIVRIPELVEDREQKQGIFRTLSENFSLLDQQTCPLRSRLGIRRSKPFDMLKRVREGDLKLDLFATQRGSGRQGCDLVQASGELRLGFDQRRALQRLLSRLAPPFDRCLGEARLGPQRFRR